MPRRIDLGRAVLAAGSALLFVSLFIRWYDTGQNAWEVFEALDLTLAILALLGLVTAIRPDLIAAWAAWAVPAAALAIVFVQMVNAPPAAGLGSDPATGAWLALAGSFAMCAGAVLSLTSISISVSLGEQDHRRRVPAVDRRDEAARGGDDAAEGSAPGTTEPSGEADPRGNAEPGARERQGRFGARETPSPAAGPADEAQRTQPFGRMAEGGEEDARSS